MMKQNLKNHPSRVRSSGGQTTLQSFLFKPRVADGELKNSPLPPPEYEEESISPAAPPKREIIRVTTKTIKEKASAFSSVGSSSSGNNGGGEAGGASAPSAAVFRRFNGSSSPAARAESSRGGGSAEAGGDADDDGGGCGVRLDVEDIAAAGSRGRRELSRKRKSPLGGYDEHRSSTCKHVVVLGDDPKPRPPGAMSRRGRQARPASRGEGDQALYNHYASGGGWCTETRRASTARRWGGPTTCGKAWVPSRSEAWSGTRNGRQRGARPFTEPEQGLRRRRLMFILENITSISVYFRKYYYRPL